MPNGTLALGIILCSALAAPSAARAQLRSSAPASVSQTLDGTTITIAYSRPRARGRRPEQVFGRGVRWGEPWTPGANMATTLDVSRDFSLNGRSLAKGTYSVWMVPRQSGEWTVILDPRFRRYHSVGIDSTADQIRFPVHTEEAPFTDALTWSILEMGPNSATITMQWFTTRVTLNLTGQPSLASIISAESAAAYAGRYDVTCKRPSEELCHRVAGDTAKTIPLLVTRENGRLTGRYPAQSTQPDPFILARIGEAAFAYAWYTTGGGDVVTEVPEWMTFTFRMVSGQATGFEVSNYRNEVLATAMRVTPPKLASEQAIRCRLRRVADQARIGACVQFNTDIGQITVRPAAASRSRSWVGTTTTVDGASQPVIIDLRGDGAIQLGDDWLAVTAAKEDATSVEFSLAYGETAPPTAIDVEILRRARAYLSDSTRWNRTDDNDMSKLAGFNCPPTVARSMFCSVYLSSLEVAGYYAHWRPAVNALRTAIIVALKRRSPGLLVAFNNDSTTTLADVQGVLDGAMTRIQSQLSPGR